MYQQIKFVKTENKSKSDSLSKVVLKGTATFWFIVAVLGQWMFALYIAFLYAPPAFRGEMEVWRKHLTHGYVPGDYMGNLAVAAHLLLAFVVMLGGPIQFIPQIRKFAPSFHRWNGRIYVFIAFPISIAGLFMLWVHGTVGDLSQHIATSFNAVLIMLFAALAWRYAIVRDFKTHERWAFRLFLVMNGVWFFRIIFMFWVTVNGAPVGFDPETFQGPALTFIAFAQTLLPLAVLELYLLVKAKGGISARFAMAGGLLVLTLMTALGIVAATLGMWLPNL